MNRISSAFKPNTQILHHTNTTTHKYYNIQILQHTKDLLYDSNAQYMSYNINTKELPHYTNEYDRKNSLIATVTLDKTAPTSLLI